MQAHVSRRPVEGSEKPFDSHSVHLQPHEDASSELLWLTYPVLSISLAYAV
jgi:hypothetical protein